MNRLLLLTIAASTACGMKLHTFPTGEPGGEGGSDETGGAAGAVMPPPQKDAGLEPPPPDGATPALRLDARGGGGAGPDARGTPPPDSGTPPSGATVTINGTVVPREKAIVFIHIGHSDMCGRATTPASLMPFFYGTDPHLWIYGKGARWSAAKEPTACPEPGATRAGPGMAILRTALAHAPDSYFISIGHGHSGSTSGYCPNFRRTGLLYGTFMDAAKELKGKVTFGGIYTMFGITEYHLGTPGLMSPGDCIAGIAKDVREDLGDPNIPLMVGDWNMGGTGIYAPMGMYGTIGRPQIQMVPMKITRATVIPTNGLTMQD